MPRKTIFKVGLGLGLTDQLLKWWFLSSGWLVKINSGNVWDLLMALAALIVVWFWVIKNHHFGWWLFIGGLANLSDRWLRGGVVDYLSFFHWWFNLSDLLILGGLTGIGYSIFNDR